MSRTLILISKDIKEAFTSRTTYLSLIVPIIFAYTYYVSTKSVVDNLTANNVSPAMISQTSQVILNSVFESLSLIMTILICSVFSAYAVIMDKNKRTIESLLATPLKLRQLWLAKSLAVTVPAVIIGIITSIAMVAILNVLVFIPAAGFVMPGYQSLITALVLTPVMVFLVVTIVTAVQLIITNPRLASLAFTAIFFGVYFTTVTQIASGWNFSFIYLAVIAFLSAVNVVISRFLTKERIILSCKG